MKVHPVFNVNLLIPAAADPHTGQRQAPPPPVEVNGLEHFEVEEIVDSFTDRRGRGGKPRLRYVIKWAGYDVPTTEPAWSICEDVPSMARNFHRRYPKKTSSADYAGVPAETDNPGLQWDLTTSFVDVPQNTTFDGKIPGWGTGTLVAVASALVISESAETLPPRAGQGPSYNYTRLVLKHESLSDLTDLVSDSTGSISIDLPIANVTSKYRIFAFYESQTHAKNLDPQSNLTDSIFENGCYIVDHFDGKGAKVVTDFWDQYILVDGIKDLLTQVGNSGWEDSMELLSNVSWSPSLPTRFQQKFGYSLKPYLPLIIFGNNNINIQSAAPGKIQCVVDTEDRGQGYVNDYRIALRDGYAEFLGVFNNWTATSLGLQYSSQVSYNLPIDMEASIPLDGVPECASLQFRDNVDSYRQFSGPAFLADKKVVSIELGAVFGDAYVYTIPHLLWASNRAASGGVNQYVIHGQQFSGRYAKTTWPGYATFGYHVSEQHSNKQPDWEHGLEAALCYMGRVMWVQQRGVPRLDVAFYNRQSATDPIVHTFYQPNDLENGGWTYVYLSPTNFNLPQARVTSGVLSSEGLAFRAMIVESSQIMTYDAVDALIGYATSGLPVILSGDLPNYYPTGNASDKVEVESKILELASAPNIFSVDTSSAAEQLRRLHILPRISIPTNGTWFPSWREDFETGIDYAYIFCDTNSSSGAINVSTSKTPFRLNAWTGEISPLALYQSHGNTTTIPLDLAGNETEIFAFANSYPSHSQKLPSKHIVGTTSPLLGYRISKSACWTLQVSASSLHGIATFSDGSEIVLDGSDVAATIDLPNWTLTAEHWVAPADFNDSTIVADKFNTTHELCTLKSWLDIPSLANVSGLGYYSTNFTWDNQKPNTDGAYIYFSKVLHAVTVYINGQRVPPLDYNNAKADISMYLRSGSNEVLAVAPTVMWNCLQTLLPQIENAGSLVEFSGGPFGSPSQPADNGLVGSVNIIPFRNLQVL